MRVVAVKELYYGKTRIPGEEFDVADKHVKVVPVWKARGLVADASVAAARPAEADPLAGLRAEADAAGVKVDKRWGEERLKTELATAKAAQVQRRDMVAEQDGSAVTGEGMFRRYRRRDMTTGE